MNVHNQSIVIIYLSHKRTVCLIDDDPLQKYSISFPSYAISADRVAIFVFGLANRYLLSFNKQEVFVSSATVEKSPSFLPSPDNSTLSHCSICATKRSFKLARWYLVCSVTPQSVHSEGNEELYAQAWTFLAQSTIFLYTRYNFKEIM